MSTATAVRKPAPKTLAVIAVTEGMLLGSQIIKRKDFGLGNELGAVSLQGVRASLKVTMDETTGDPKSSGYRLFFETHEKNGYIDSHSAKELGLISPVGRTAEGDTVYQWTASELGFQPNPDTTKPGTWLTT